MSVVLWLLQFFIDKEMYSLFCSSPVCFLVYRDKVRHQTKVFLCLDVRLCLYKPENTLGFFLWSANFYELYFHY